MTNLRQRLRQIVPRSGLVACAALAFTAFAAIPATAATPEHWETAPLPSSGTPIKYTGEATGGFWAIWEFDSIEIEIECGSMSTAGNAENPTNGSAGKLSSTSFKLGYCAVKRPTGCQLQSSEIEFNTLFAQTGQGSNLEIHYEPVSGPYFGTLVLKGCPIAGSYPFGGHLTATPVTSGGKVGEYQFYRTELTIAGEPFYLYGRYSLSSSSGEPLVLSSVSTPGVPHWFSGAVAWSKLPEGVSTSYRSSPNAMSFELASELLSVPVQIACAGASSALEGQVENPAGGGAGLVSATMSLSSCSAVSERLHEWGCIISPFNSKSLTGVATVLKEHPAIEFSYSELGELGEVAILNCPLAGTFPLEGVLTASSSSSAGSFQLGASEAYLDGEEATISGHLTLRTGSGRALRLTP